MKTYHNMPNWLKEKGIMYIQDKNICISAGNNKIYSCKTVIENMEKMELIH